MHSHRELSPEHDRVLSAATKERKSAGVKITFDHRKETYQISGARGWKLNRMCIAKFESNQLSHARRFLPAETHTRIFHSCCDLTYYTATTVKATLRSDLSFDSLLYCIQYLFYHSAEALVRTRRGLHADCCSYAPDCCPYIVCGVKSEQPWEIFTPVFLFWVLNFHYHCNYDTLCAGDLLPLSALERVG